MTGIARRHVSSSWLLAAAALLLVAAACRGTSGPDVRERLELSDAQRWVLRSVGGRPMPAALIDNEHVLLVALGDTLWLEPDGTGVRLAREWVSARSGEPPSPPMEYGVEALFRYRVAGMRIEIDFVCADLALCVAPPHYVGVVDGGMLRITSALNYRTPLVYERVPD